MEFNLHSTSEHHQILEWQRHKQHGVAPRYYLDWSDINLAQDLAAVLNLFYEITQQVLISGSPRLSNTVVFIDQITEHLLSAISSPTYPPSLRNACQLGLKITNKYYILHPSFRGEYFKLANWEPNWITEAMRLAREMWILVYKPKPVESTPSSSSTNNWPKTSMLAGLGSAAAARGGILSSNPLDIWLAGGLILDGNKPVNPLKWWSQQKRAGNPHGGLCKSWICSSLDRYGQGSGRVIQAGRRAWNGQSSGTRVLFIVQERDQFWGSLLIQLNRIDKEEMEEMLT
ncbi:hypothetical protein PSTG_06774 [Puccinia striiformis f. sp. tritici PST-78]|uniref:Uncharacterized protein n=1 Tax=Puccinia striiformis f. sp. tritici PST-78 TaxID=1165861 RepID=A0A0L0VKX5_9BASI|nr:hypothetical protein PSTG_06774 [Puccinia striiformis f. sp. tritici PST-78]